MASHRLPGLVLGLIALQAVDDLDPEQLVTRLGAPRYADREAAGEALVKIGSAALPALTRACQSKDPEVRLRALTLEARIEAHEVVGATRVRLHIHDRPLAEAAETIARLSGMGLKPGTGQGTPGVDPTWPQRQTTLQAAEPVPFWDVIDRLCRAADLQREYPPASNSFFPFKPPFELTLVPGKARPPASDTGAFRVELLRVHHHRERDYGNNKFEFSASRGTTVDKQDVHTGVIEHSSYAAELLVSAEPRLRIFGVGELEKSEAIDDQGRSLLRTPAAQDAEQQQLLWRMNPHIDPRLHPELRYGLGSHTSMRTWPIRVLLSYPAPPARRIATLRGVIPLVVVGRRSDPLVVELKGATSKKFSAGSTSITVHEINTDSGREPTVDFTLETDHAGAEETIPVCDSKGAHLTVNRPLDLLELRLEVLDSRGVSLFWQFTRAPTERTQGRMAIVIHDRSAKRNHPDLLRLRYWELIGAATDLPFAFKDVPTP
jgi:hypothetical protein